MGMESYSKLLKTVSEYSGHNCQSSSNKRFLRRVLERLYRRGDENNLMQVCMCVHKGCVTLPEELQNVEKAKINCEIQQVWSHWFEFNSNSNSFSEDTKTGFQNVSGYYATQYDSPQDEFYPVVRARGKECPTAHIIIHGIHAKTGEKVFIKHKGSLNSGEFLPVEQDTFMSGSVPLRKIIGVEKTETNDYIDLYADVGSQELFQLSSYNPRETKPSYKRIKVMGCLEDHNYEAVILGRIKVLNNYHNNELLAIQSMDALETIAQEIKSQKTGQIQESVTLGQVAENIIKQENNKNFAGQDNMNFISLDDTDDPYSGGGVF